MRFLSCCGRSPGPSISNGSPSPASLGPRLSRRLGLSPKFASSSRGEVVSPCGSLARTLGGKHPLGRKTYAVDFNANAIGCLQGSYGFCAQEPHREAAGCLSRHGDRGRLPSGDAANGAGAAVLVRPGSTRRRLLPGQQRRLATGGAAASRRAPRGGARWAPFVNMGPGRRFFTSRAARSTLPCFVAKWAQSAQKQR